MQRIRIKTAPKLGDQVDYSFYDSRYRNAGMGGSAEDEVKTTMGPVPREEASIEVERGEVVVGDTNKDGFLELFTFTGKPHSKGGTPVDVPAGSFIYSNTRKLRIKDEEVLKKVFGLSPKKGGYTPAEIAKNYQINQYVADLKNPDADNITKRSANEMLKNNLQKLSTLALIQESMKGFPDGIPAIAEMAASALGVTPEMVQQPQGPEQMPQEQAAPEQMPMGKWGGLKKYQNAGEAQKVRPTGDQIALTPATVVYINGKPHRYLAGESQINTLSPNEYVFQDAQTGHKFYINEHDFNRSYNKSVPHDRIYGDQYLHYYIGESADPFIGDDWYKYNYGIDVAGTKLNTGDLFFKGNDMYRVEWPYAARKYQNHPHSSASVKAVKVNPVYDATGTKVVGYNPMYGAQTENIFQQDLLTAAENRQFARIDLGQSNMQSFQSQQTGAGDISKAGSNGAPVLYDANANKQQQPDSTTQQQPAKQTTITKPKTGSNSAPKKTVDLSDFEDGGAYLPSYDMVGIYGLTKFQNAGQNDEQFVDEITDANGRKVKRYRKGDVNIVRDAQTGAVIEMKDKKTGVKREYKPDGVRVYNSKGQLMDYEAPEVTGGYDQKTYQNKYAKDIETYEQIIQKPENQELRNTLYQEYRQAINSSTKIPQDKKNELLNLSQNDVINYLLQGNKDNLLIRSAYGDQGDFMNTEAWDRFGDIYDEKGNLVKGSGKNKVYNAVANRLGFKPMDEVGRIAFQAAYRASKEIARDPKYIKQFQSAGFEIDPQGKADADSDEMNVSYIDDYYGNNTSKQTWMVTQPTEPETPKTEPGKKQAYYCVESEDGSRGVQTVEYAEGSQPTPPTGKKVTPYESLEKAQAECQAYDKGFPPPGRRKEGPWWAQDIVNFAYESTRDIPRFKPAKQQVDFVTPEWTTISNAATIANAQGNAAMAANLAQNSTDGNTAIAANLGTTGETLQAIALSDAQTNATNAQTSTQAGQFNSQIENTERDQNTKYGRQYMVDLATEGQQNWNANNLQDRNKLRALIAGMTNNKRKKLQEQVKTPQVYIDPINFNAEFSGQGRDIQGPDLYVPGYATGYAAGAGRRGTGNAYATGAAMNSDAGIKAYKETFESLRAELGDDAAKQAALGEMNRVNALLRSNPMAAMYGNDAYAYSGMGFPGYERDGGAINYAIGGAVVTPEDMFRILIKRKTGR